MNFLCKFLGGSHLYGLNTAESDEDERGVYVTDDVAKLFGFETDKSVVSTSDELDKAYYEVRRFFHLLKKTNTASVEFMFAPPEVFTYTTKMFTDMQTLKFEFLDSKHLLNSLRGYTHGERRLALGERSGALGGKRKAQLEKHGFSPKNVSHMVRLAYCCETFFTTGDYPVNVSGTRVFDLCMNLKTNPEDYTVEDVVKICDGCVESVMSVEDTMGSEFNVGLACEMLKKAYASLLV